MDSGKVLAMQKLQSTSEARIASEPGSAKAGMIRQAFADTSTWDEILRILEEEALRRFA